MSMNQKLNKENLIKAVFATEEKVTSYRPIQIQKLLFLLERKLGQQYEGKAFKFEAYDYGPYDKEIYWILDEFKNRSLIKIQYSEWPQLRTYEATDLGLEEGKKVLDQLHSSVSSYIILLSKWIRQLNFIDLVTYIYKEYPDFAVNSVLQVKDQE